MFTDPRTQWEPWWLAPPGGTELGLPSPTALPAQMARPDVAEPQILGPLHVVQRGQSAWQIARMYGVDLADLIRINRLAPPYRLYPGQTLRLPRRRR